MADKPATKVPMSMNAALDNAGIRSNVLWLGPDQQQRLAESGHECYITDIYEKERKQGDRKWHVWFTVDDIECAVSWNPNPMRDAQFEALKPLLKGDAVIGPVVLRGYQTEYDNAFYYFEEAGQPQQQALPF